MSDRCPSRGVTRSRASSRVDRLTRGGRTAAVFLAASSLLAPKSSVAQSSIDRVKSSVVRIEVVGFDGSGQPQLPADPGTGTVLSPSGLILTALHVLVPFQDWRPLAVRYEIRVYGQTDSGGWGIEPIAIVSSDSLAKRLTIARPSDLRPCGGSELFPPYPCLSERPARDRDFAFLDARCDPPLQSFLDIMGPRDSYSHARCSANQWKIFVASEFEGDGLVRVEAATYPEFRVPYRVEVPPPHGVDHGRSGSPLIVLAGPSSAPFVAGVLVENPRLPTGEPRRRVADVVLLREVMDSLTSEARLPFSPENVSHCRPAVGGAGAPLLLDYYSFLEGSMDQGNQNRFTICLDEHPTWSATQEFLRAYRSLLPAARAIATSLATLDSSRPLLPQVTAPLDAQLAAYYQTAREAGVDAADQLRTFSRRSLAACEDRYPPCERARCSEGCDVLDLPCVARVMACEQGAVAGQQTCEEIRTAQIAACRDGTAGQAAGRLAAEIAGVASGAAALPPETRASAFRSELIRSLR